MTVLAQQALPRAFHGWLAAASLSTFGDTALYFALGWAATGLGPGVAGLVLTAFVVPRAVLLIAGGVLGDRWGPRRVMIAGDAALLVLTAVLAGVVGLIGTTSFLLLATALAIGVVDAFYLPASGSFPRLFATDEQLPKAMALRGSTSQAINLVGGPVAGVIVAVAGLAGALLVDSITFAVSLVVLLLVKPPYDVPPPVRGESVLAAARDGLRTAWADPMLRSVLVAVGLVAAFVLPVISLCVPLLVRSHGWSSTDAGLIAGASVGGTLLVTLVVARRGAFARAGLVTAVGPVVAAVGMTGLALAPTALAAAVAGLVQGLGVGLFTSHMGPLFVASTPRSHLIRLQSLLVLVQTLPLLVSNNLIGVLVARWDARFATMTCATGTAMAGLALLATRRIRSAEAPGPGKFRS